MNARRWPALAFALLVPALIAAPALSPAVQLYYRDTGRLYYPVKKLIATELLHGRLALWDADTESGVSLLGQVTPGLLHPFTLLYSVFPFDLAFKLNHLFALPLAALGAWLLARRLGASPWAAATAAVAYGTSGYLLSMVSSNLPYALGAATVPFALEALLRCLDEVTPRRLLWAGLALALCTYAGEPQSMLIAGVLGACLALGLSPWSRRALARTGALVAAWGAAGLLLSGPASLPALARFRISPRAQGLNATEKRWFANSPFRLPGIAIPLAFDDQVDEDPVRGGEQNPFPHFFSAGPASFSDSITLGLPAMLLALFAAASSRRGLALFGGGVLLLLASAGQSLGVLGTLTLVLPPLGWFRYAEKLIAPASLLFSLGAALGADAALNGSRKAALRLFGLASAVLVLSATFVLWTRGAAQPPAWLANLGGVAHEAAPTRALFGLLRSGLTATAALSFALALCAALRLSRQAAATLAVAAAAACCAGAGLTSGARILLGPIDLLHGPFPLGELLVSRAGPSRGNWRLYVSRGLLDAQDPVHDARQLSVATLGVSLAPQFEQLAGIQGASHYFSTWDPDYHATAAGATYNALRLLRARFAVLLPGGGDLELAKRRGFEEVAPQILLRDLGPTLPAVLVRGGARAADRAETVRLLAKDAIDPERTALVAPAAAPLIAGLPADGPEAAGRGRLLWSGARQRMLDVDARVPAVVTLSEHFDEGWSAAIDGKPAPVFRADGMLLGVSAPAGHHQIELRFWPHGLTAGLAALALAVVLLGGWSLARRHRLSAK